MNSDGSSSIVVVDEKHRKPGVIITITKSKKKRRPQGTWGEVNEWFAVVRARVPRGAQLQIPWWLSCLTVPLAVLAAVSRPTDRPRVPARVQTVHATTSYNYPEFATESDAKGPHKPAIAIRRGTLRSTSTSGRASRDRRGTPTIRRGVRPHVEQRAYRCPVRPPAARTRHACVDLDPSCGSPTGHRRAGELGKGLA